MSALVEYITQYVDMFDLTSHYGLHTGERREVFIHCPFHSESTPSARFYLDGLLYCFGCNKMYDPINFIMGMEEIGFRQATSWLEENYDFKIPESYFKREYSDDEKQKWAIEIMKYKGQLPFDTYLLLWKMFDTNTLTESNFNSIIFKSGIL